jgi:sugar O-acyltransferase (sialic acid O-acetyltransferase NeuD family)
MREKLIIYGIGRFAEYVKYAFQYDSDFEIAAFSIESSLHETNTFAGLPLVPFEDLAQIYPPDSYYIFVAVGQNEIRARIFEEAKSRRYNLASYVSSKAITWNNLEVGSNCFIGEGSTIQPFVKIKNNCILFAANIGHHSTIGDNVLISAMTLGGNVEVGNNCFLGMNSTVAQNVKIAEKTIIGMGCSISGDTQSNSVYASNTTSKRKISYEEVVNRFLK